LTLTIAVGSALLALFTLWLTRLRPGSIKLASNPPVYFTEFEGDTFRLRMPIVFKNPGSRPAVINGLRIKHPPNWPGESVAYVYSLYDNIEGAGGRFFEPITVDGGTARVTFVDFLIYKVHPEDVTAQVYHLVLESARGTRLDADGNPFRWKKLGTIRLSVTEHERVGFVRPNAHFNGFREPPAPVVAEATRLASTGVETNLK
jgi:hypothetical protein